MIIHAAHWHTVLGTLCGLWGYPVALAPGEVITCRNCLNLLGMLKEKNRRAS